MRQIVLDTETTGLETSEGHRIIEIGAVELVDRRLTGRHFHQFLQPDREIDAGALEVHGITQDFLADKPRFADIVEPLLAFLQGAELIIHNAAFDVGFLNYELGLLGGMGTLEQRCTVFDTLYLARQLHPGQKNNLDALCKRYGIDNSHRELHGALLDAEILADVYLAMTGGQSSLVLDAQSNQGPSANVTAEKIVRVRTDRPVLHVLRASETELVRHDAMIAKIDAKSGGRSVWREASAEQSSN